jgi:hypothetical protein
VATPVKGFILNIESTCAANVKAHFDVVDDDTLVLVSRERKIDAIA